jgi:hypothetical protein
MTVFFFGKNALHDQRPAMAQDILAQIFLSIAKTVTDETGHELLQRLERLFGQKISARMAD